MKNNYEELYNNAQATINIINHSMSRVFEGVVRDERDGRISLARIDDIKCVLLIHKRNEKDINHEEIK